MRRLALLALLLTGCAHGSERLAVDIALLVAEVALIQAVQSQPPPPPPPPLCGDGDLDPPHTCPGTTPPAPPPPEDDAYEPGR
jgi:hypothetical protein